MAEISLQDETKTLEIASRDEDAMIETTVPRAALHNAFVMFRKGQLTSNFNLLHTLLVHNAIFSFKAENVFKTRSPPSGGTRQNAHRLIRKFCISGRAV